jgi:hypothetical protein
MRFFHKWKEWRRRKVRDNELGELLRLVLARPETPHWALEAEAQLRAIMSHATHSRWIGRSGSDAVSFSCECGDRFDVHRGAVGVVKGGALPPPDRMASAMDEDADL